MNEQNINQSRSHNKTMKQPYLANVTIFKSLFDSKETAFVLSIEDVYQRIKTGVGGIKELVEQIRQQTDKDNNLKKQLKAILFAGEFTQRNSESLTNHSGLMITGFDGFETDEVLNEWKEKLKSNPYVFMLFVSHSGNGLKAIVRIPKSDAKDHSLRHKAFEKHINCDYFDRSNKDVARVCFESYDPNIYLNQYCEVFEDIEQEEENIFLGQNPQKKDKSKLRLIKPLYLKDSAFAYDLWEFKFNTNLNKHELTSLYYEGMRTFINSKDFYKRQLTKQSHIYIKDENNIIDEVTPDRINEEVRSYVDEIKTTTSFEYNNNKYSIPHDSLKNVYLKQHHNIINTKWLTNIKKHDRPILKDTKTTSYFVFNNCFVEVTKDNIELKSFDSLKGYCVWKDQVINRDFIYKKDRDGQEGEFEKFVINVCNKEPDRLTALKSAIGYLLNNFSNPTKGQAVIFYDEALSFSNKPSGGTGKGLLVNAVKQLRPTAKIDGKNYKSDDKFKWSNIKPSTQVVWIDETNNNFNFEDLFSCLTDGWQVERKFENKFDIEPKNSPKVVICSNTIIENKGSSNKRRQFIVELSDYYSKKIITGTETPIADEHGILFSDEWSNKEWNKFYSFMLDCSQYYLKNSLCDYEHKNVEKNLLKQQTCDEFMDYVLNYPPPIDEPFDIKPLFEQFKSEHIGDDNKMVQRTFTNWIKKYCISIHHELKNVGKSNGTPFYKITKK